MREFDADNARTLAENSDKFKQEYLQFIKLIQIAASDGEYGVFTKKEMSDIVKTKLESRGFNVQECTQIQNQKDGLRFYISWRKDADCRSAND